MTDDLTILPFKCPFCVGGRATAEPDSERCHHCSGIGLTGQPCGDAERAPRPPGVMRAPCTDCAYRPGSPEREEDDGTALPESEPFFCHQGMPVNRAGEYTPVATYRGLPLGAKVCAGWWASQTGETPSATPYRDVPLADTETRWGSIPYALRDTTQEAP